MMNQLKTVVLLGVQAGHSDSAPRHAVSGPVTATKLDERT
jgi:hypothetical protein